MDGAGGEGTWAGISIRQDAQGRFCLNDLHKAAGGENRHRPSVWSDNQQTTELIEEIGKAGIPALVAVRGGTSPGTYVCKELVYAYAMWISPKFHLQVIRAYDELVTIAQVGFQIALGKLLPQGGRVRLGRV